MTFVHSKSAQVAKEVFTSLYSMKQNLLNKIMDYTGDPPNNIGYNGTFQKIVPTT